jgi:nucleotide-binding universal stress UspA family protein
VIVVGTDGSDRAWSAVKEALALAKVTGARVHGVHALRPLSATGVDAAEVALADAIRHDESSRIDKQLIAEAEKQGVSATMETLEGDPADALVRTAASVHADLVVVGNRGMTGMRRFVLGSVSNKVSHHCPCSLLIVGTEPS